MLVENAVFQSLFVILSNLQLIMNLFAFSLKFRAYTRFRALLEIPRANTNSAQFRVNSARADSVWPYLRAHHKKAYILS
jgi:hypothetical protein